MHSRYAISRERLATVAETVRAGCKSTGLIAADSISHQLPTGLVLAASSHNSATGNQQQRLTPSSAVLAGEQG